MKRLLLGAAAILVVLALVFAYTASRRDRLYTQLIAQGETELARDEPFAAIEAFSGAILLKPESMLGYLKRGDAYRRQGELREALKDLRKAVELDPTAPRPLELLGDVNYAMQRYDRAADQYQRYVQLDDRSPRLLYKVALTRYSAGQPAAAVDALRKALALDDRFGEAHYLLGLCLRDLQRPREALRAFERSVAASPSLLQAQDELADVYRRFGRTADRLARLEAALALDPSPSRQVALGLAYADAGNTERAVSILGAAADRYPEYRQTYVALGRVWLEIAQVRRDRISLSKALEALEQAAGSEESSEALTLFGRALLMASDEELAERMLQQATQKQPVEPLAFFYLAEAAERRKHPDAARRALLDYRALKGDDTDPRRRAALHARIADLSAQANDPAGAVLWYQRALDPADPDAGLLLKLADAQARAGDPTSARATLESLLQREPDNRAAQALRRRVR